MALRQNSLKKGSFTLTVQITLHDSSDRDLIELLQAVPDRKMASTIINLMRTGCSSSEDTPAEPTESTESTALQFMPSAEIEL